MTKECEECLGKSGFRLCAVCDANPSKTKQNQTNADRIRAMSDEELAEFMERNAGCDDCRFFTTCRSAPQDRVCTEYWLDWLKEEVSDATDTI